MKESFVVTDGLELQALHRALFEAQFAVTPLDRDVPGSPLLANLSNRVVDALTTIDPRWENWRSADNHPDRVAIARTHLAANPRWATMSRHERVAQVHNQLAPLVPSEELVATIIGGAV